MTPAKPQLDWHFYMGVPTTQSTESSRRYVSILDAQVEAEALDRLDAWTLDRRPWTLPWTILHPAPASNT